MLDYAEAVEHGSTLQCVFRTDHVLLHGWFVRQALRILCPTPIAQ